MGNRVAQPYDTSVGRKTPLCRTRVPVTPPGPPAKIMGNLTDLAKGLSIVR